MNTVRNRNWNALFLILLLAAAGSLVLRLTGPEERDVELAGYATSLKGRTPSQRHNAEMAMQALDGVTIAPGATFSFNRTVKSWSMDQGYVKAPVSYDGELIRAYGGGVCQTSTTLYNAALLAGLPIVERHPHVFAPHYVPPGRDAAVAQKTIDLRFRNCYAWPLRIRAVVRADLLDIRLLGSETPTMRSDVGTEVLSSSIPEHLTRVVYRPGDEPTRAYVRNPGARGYRVLSYRVFSSDGKEVRRERLSDDSYEAMNRVVQVAEEETARR